VTTVLTLPGADSLGNMATVQAAFGGPRALLTQLRLPDDTPPTVIGVTYRDYDSFNGYIDAANQLEAKLNAVAPADTAVIVGHSYGAVGICQWLRSYATNSCRNPDRTVFVLAGNSIRPRNGYCTMMGLYGPGSGPATVTYPTYDAAREFDKWADQPNNMASPAYWQAVGNCNAGDQTSGSVNGVPNNIHNSYQNVRLNDPAAARVRVGAVTFSLHKTDPIPSAAGLTRAQIATAYQRIVAATW
jgi:hypothetical protein